MSNEITKDRQVVEGAPEYHEMADIDPTLHSIDRLINLLLGPKIPKEIELPVKELLYETLSGLTPQNLSKILNGLPNKVYEIRDDFIHNNMLDSSATAILEESTRHFVQNDLNNFLTERGAELIQETITWNANNTDRPEDVIASLIRDDQERQGLR